MSRVDLVPIADELRAALRELRFGEPVTHVYSPLEYAWQAHRSYLERFGSSSRELVLVGMNPGPWGMAQTGVPFGETAAVRDWLQIYEATGRPTLEHPKRPVMGLDCSRSEVSGRRLWGWARDRFGTPASFFERFFIANYCPLMFLESSGRNRTPDRLPKGERAPLEAACDNALRKTVEALNPRLVIGLGKFATDRAAAALGDLDAELGRILHPSPANPAANRGWAEQAERELAALGVELP
jgi:single-strand selective monofunctional uracil DNA glycosylase